MATSSCTKPQSSGLHDPAAMSEPSDRRLVPRFRVRFRAVLSVPGTAKEKERLAAMLAKVDKHE